MTSITLDAHYEKFVQDLLEEGRYDSPQDVVQAGLQMLEDHESAREQWLRQELPGRWAEHLADPSSGIPAEEVHARLRERMAAKR